MKHGKVPTRNQKELMLKNNLNPKEWLVVKKMADGFEIVNRENEADRKFLYCLGEIMMDIYTRLLIMDIMISAVAIMVNILENCPINGKIHNISRILIISSIAADIILLLGIVNTFISYSILYSYFK